MPQRLEPSLSSGASAEDVNSLARLEPIDQVGDEVSRSDSLVTDTTLIDKELLELRFLDCSHYYGHQIDNDAIHYRYQSYFEACIDYSHFDFAIHSFQISEHLTESKQKRKNAEC